MSTANTAVNQAEFKEVVDFHGCYCLDIAMGYRVAKALVREMGDEMKNMKQVFAYVSAPTCAMDAIQKITGCTLGKRNLILDETGKSAFTLQNAASGKAVRAYVHYWDDHDHTALRQKRKDASAPAATPEQRATLQSLLDAMVNEILAAPEAELFSMKDVKLPVPPKSSKFVSIPCSVCAEHAKEELMTEKQGAMVCKECV